MYRYRLKSDIYGDKENHLYPVYSHEVHVQWPFIEDIHIDTINEEAMKIPQTEIMIQ